MDSFFPFAFYVFYKLLALIPLILILISIIKLHRKEKSTATYLMLAGNIGLLSKITVIDSLSDYLIRFSHTINVQSISSIYSVLNILTLIFSILFASGFLMFINGWLKKQS
ncbi:MAG: hypothetical protein V4506_00680 [Bacteroidota bacterium]